MAGTPARPLIDSHLHFGCASRFDGLSTYLNRMNIAGVGLLSLPDHERINFNPEVLYAKTRLAKSRFAKTRAATPSGAGSPAAGSVSGGAGVGLSCSAFASFDYADRFAPGAGIAPLPFEEQVDRFAAAGFDGLKLWEGKPAFQQRIGMPFDDGRFAGAFRAAARHGMPVVLHVADPPLFWDQSKLKGAEARLGWSPGSDSYPLPSFEELMRQTVAVLERHPDCVFIFPHFLFLAGDLPRLAALLDRHANAFLDLSPGVYYYAELHRVRAHAIEFFNTYRDRILFGSDGMWFCRESAHLPQSGLDENCERTARLYRFLATAEEFPNPFQYTMEQTPAVRGLDLPPETLEAIFDANYRQRIWKEPRGPAIRAVSRDAALDYLELFGRRLESLTEALRPADGGAAERPARRSDGLSQASRPGAGEQDTVTSFLAVVDHFRRWGHE